ncbi:MAG: hypothetical protein ACI4VB_08950 [Bradymonadia bacterium]
MERLAMVIDSADPILIVYHEDDIPTYGLDEEETKPFQQLLDSVEERFSVNAICGEYYETLGFETQQEKDELIADAFKLFGEVKRHLSGKYKIDDYPDLTMLYETPAGRREELRRAYAKEHHLS